MQTSLSTEKKTFPIIGMSCASCATSVESMLGAQPGVEKASVNFASNSALVEYNPSTVRLEDFKTAVQSIGYDIVIDEKASGNSEEIQVRLLHELKAKTIWSAALSLLVIIIGMFSMETSFGQHYGNWTMMVLTAPVLFWLGRTFFINAYKQAKHRQANMDTLVALSTGIAFLFSIFNTAYPQFWHARGLHAYVYFEAAASVITFILLGKLLEERAKANTSSALKKLMGLQPHTVTVATKDGELKEIPIAQVKVKDVVVIRAGDKIPVDGVVISGSSYVDESTISGEPIAVAKTEGSKVFSGTINQQGSFQISAEKVGSETILARIIQAVQEAQGSKAPVQKLVDKIAGIFVPVVIAISLLTFVAWLLLGGENGLTYGLITMVAVLVIACPCALGLATPTAIMVGIGKGAANGILIKDAESLERAYKVDAVVLDKTGTLTEGKPKVVDITWKKNDDTLPAVLYTLESSSSHPLAEAVAAYLKKTAVKLTSLEQITNVIGKGVTAQGETNGYAIGNYALMQAQHVVVTEDQLREAESKQQDGNTVVYFAENNSVVAIIAIADEVKTTSAEAVRALSRLGIAVYMLTGDNQQTAAAVAKEVGIQHFQSGMLPSGKADFVKKLRAQGKTVAMAGDGINDSEALAVADVSIAMGKGSDLAMDVARITLMSADLLQIPRALKLSKLTVTTIRQNLFWAFVYNIIGIPIAAGVLYPLNGFLLSPMIAGAAMALSSVSVVANSLRLKTKKLN